MNVAGSLSTAARKSSSPAALKASSAARGARVGLLHRVLDLSSAHLAMACEETCPPSGARSTGAGLFNDPVLHLDRISSVLRVEPAANSSGAKECRASRMTLPRPARAAMPDGSRDRLTALHRTDDTAASWTHIKPLGPYSSGRAISRSSKTSSSNFRPVRKQIPDLFRLGTRSWPSINDLAGGFVQTVGGALARVRWLDDVNRPLPQNTSSSVTAFGIIPGL